MAPVGPFEGFPNLDFASEGHAVAANNIPILFVPAKRVSRQPTVAIQGAAEP
jgi:hypothetical protein